jgi:hypothetical protein
MDVKAGAATGDTENRVEKDGVLQYNLGHCDLRFMHIMRVS